MVAVCEGECVERGDRGCAEVSEWRALGAGEGGEEASDSGGIATGEGKQAAHMCSDNGFTPVLTTNPTTQVPVVQLLWWEADKAQVTTQRVKLNVPRHYGLAASNLHTTTAHTAQHSVMTWHGMTHERSCAQPRTPTHNCNNA